MAGEGIIRLSFEKIKHNKLSHSGYSMQTGYVAHQFV